MTAAAAYRLFGAPGWGSVLAELALTRAELPYEMESGAFVEDTPLRRRLLAVNPLAQVPTLILPDGTVMTESAAIVLHLHDVAPHAHLAPPAGAPERPSFLRWLTFIVAAIYPTFTYGDWPDRWTAEGKPAETLRDRTNAHREMLWRFLETQVEPDPYFLGQRFSALDLYIGAMVFWRPRRDWFAANCPRLNAVAGNIHADPQLRPIFVRNFPGVFGDRDD